MRGKDKGSDRVPEQLVSPGDQLHTAAQANQFILPYAYVLDSPVLFIYLFLTFKATLTISF